MKIVINYQNYSNWLCISMCLRKYVFVCVQWRSPLSDKHNMYINIKTNIARADNCLWSNISDEIHTWNIWMGLNISFCTGRIAYTTKDYPLEYYYAYNLFHKNILLIPEEAYWPSDCISWLSFEARLTQKYIWNFLWFDRYLPKSCQEKLRKKSRGIGC